MNETIFLAKLKQVRAQILHTDSDEAMNNFNSSRKKYKIIRCGKSMFNDSVHNRTRSENFDSKRYVNFLLLLKQLSINFCL